VVVAAVVAAAVAVVVGGVRGAGTSVAVPVWGAPVQSGTLSHGEPDEIRTVDLNGDGLRDVIVGPLVWERFDAQAPIFLINKGGGKLVDETSQLFDGSPPRSGGGGLQRRPSARHLHRRRRA
jgi:hypothetical protein